MNTSMGRPVADLDDFLEVAPEPLLKTAPETSVTSDPRKVRGVWWIIGAVAVLVAGFAAYWTLGRPSGPLPVSGTVESTAVAPSGVGGFAEMYVAAYLTDSTDGLDEFLPRAPSTDSMTPAAHYVTGTAAMEVEPTGPGYWSVTVAADVLGFEGDGYRPVGLQYFQVGVVDDGGRLVAVALPARVSGPAVRSAPPRSLQLATEPPSDVQTALVGDFLEALLTGGREINRYVAIDSGIMAISPIPYEALSVTSVALYQDGSALATVDAQESTGAIVTMQYIMRLADEGAGPVVAELLPGPPALGTSQGDGR